MVMGTPPILELVLGGLCLYIMKTLLFPGKMSAPLPPGPRAKRIIGNLTDLPPSKEPAWVHWAKHKDLYGPISSVTVFGQTLIIINDPGIASEILEKRSILHSSRPKSTFGGEMVGWENSLMWQPYSDRFRAFRKDIHAIIGTKTSVSLFYDDIGIEVRRFLLRVLEDPEKVLQHIRTEAGAIILKISHGYTIQPSGRDPLVDLAEEAMLQLSLSVIPGAWLVDVLPLLKYVPAWLPGMAFKRTAARWRKTTKEFVEKPYAFVKQQMAAAVHAPSYTSALLKRGNLTTEKEFEVKWSAASLYAGGTSATVSSLSTFFLAMTLYPEGQRRAQEEIDRVVGNDRLPGLEDREYLPYVNAIMKEVLRWHPIAPTVIHASTEDDIYKDYLIPKDALLLAGVWWFTHDPKSYHDPMVFKPERFLDIGGHTPEMDPRNLVFGFGRRVCPGRELADTTLYLTIAQSLAVFNISKVLENGKIVEPVVSFTSGLVSAPLPFKAGVTPRSAKAEMLIRTIEEEHPFTPGDSKALPELSI